MIWHNRAAALEDHLREMNAMGVVVAEQTSRYLQVTDLIVQDTSDRIIRAGITSASDLWLKLATPAFQDYLAGKVRNVSAIDGVSVFDASGQLVNSSRAWPVKAVDSSDRDFFKYFRDHDDSNVFIGSTAISRATGALSLFVVRRINGSDGRFAGVVLGVVDIGRLVDFYQTAGDQLHETVILVRRDGTVLLRYPDPEASAGIKLSSNSPWFATVAKGGGSYTTTATIDRARSLIIVHLLQEFPLVVDIVMHEADVFAKWHREAVLIGGFAAGASIVISLLCWVVARQVRRQDEQHAQLEQAAITLNENRQTVQAYAEMSADWFWEQDSNFRFLRPTVLPSTPGFDGIGLTRWELPGVMMSEARWAPHKADLAARRPFRNFRMERTRADGTVRHMIVNGDPIFDPNGVFTGYRGTGRDVSAEVEATHRLAQANAELELGRHQIGAVLDNIKQGVCFFDGDHRLQLWNRRYSEIYGLPGEEIQVGLALRDILRLRETVGNAPDLSGPDYANWVRTITTIAEPANMVIPLRDGRIVSVYQHPMPGGGWVATHEDITERQKAEASIAYMACHDALTRLPNRGLFQDRMEQAIAMAGRGSGFAVMCLDLDNFKQVNDTLGHPVGDALLIAVADRLAACGREGDTVARVGGDEFAIIQLGVDKREDAEALTNRIMMAFRQPFALDGREVLTGISIGVTVASDASMVPETLMKNTDLALYLAKTEGRGMVRFFEPGMDAHIRLRRTLEMDLQGAIVRNEFELFYQPQIDLADNRLVGFEALLRWRHPTRGLVSPLDFIPVAEETGMIVAIGEWALRTACFEAENWPPGIMVAVNLSPVQFRKGDLVATVRAALAASGLPPDRLELEITESVMLGDTAGTLTVLHALRASGICIALDDFGTGYSSLSYLHSFPFDKIKIDQSFVRDLLKNKEAMSIIRAVTGLGHSLNIRTTAEGVETCEQLARLREEGCSQVQGYLFSRPVPAKELPELIERLSGAHAAIDAENV